MLSKRRLLVGICIVTALTMWGGSVVSAKEGGIPLSSEVRMDVIKTMEKYIPSIMTGQRVTYDDMVEFFMEWKQLPREDVEKVFKGTGMEVESGDRKHGQFRGDDIRSQECTYVLAYLYQEPESIYYGSDLILNRVLWSIDYMTRAQGANGGFQDSWVGVPIRKDAYNCVAGFTLYSIARSITLLIREPAVQAALDEMIDTDGLGMPNVKRRDGWLEMLSKATHWITYSQRGHGPNQDVGNVVSAYAINEAYSLLHPKGEKAVPDRDIDAITERCLADPTWWSNQGMLKERNGQNPAGYDSHYGTITLYWLSLLTYYNNKAVDRLVKYADVFQYFHYPERFEGDEILGPHIIEGRVANRHRGEGKQPEIVAIALSQQYHPAMRAVYAKEFDVFEKSPGDYFTFGSGHQFTETMYKYVDLLLYGTEPLEADYVLPTESGEPWIYLDPPGRVLVCSTEEGYLVYVSLVRYAPDSGFAYNVVGVKHGFIEPNMSRRLDSAVVRSRIPYAYDNEFPPLDELVNEAYALVDDVLKHAGAR